jgi:hypothetical protein
VKSCINAGLVAGVLVGTLAPVRAEDTSSPSPTIELTRLMPPETLAYIEVRNTGKQVERLADMLGLFGSPKATGTAPAAGARVPEPRPKEVLSRLRLSPALVRELSKVGGLAVAITGIAPDAPEGVAVIDPGACDLLRGLLETSIPALTPIGEIEGWPAYGIDRAGIVITERHILAGFPREHVTALAKRLRSVQAKTAVPSLADDPGLVQTRSWQADALIFGYVNAQAAVPMLMKLAEQSGGNPAEARMVEALFDLHKLTSIALRAGVTETGLTADLGVRFAEGHQSLVFNLTRTPPLSTNSLKCVPVGAASVLAFALSSPDAVYASGVDKSAQVRQITGLDFGREAFANIEEVALFVMPPDNTGPGASAPRIDDEYVPDAGLVMTVKDPGQSDAIWSQLLSLPTMLLGPSEASADPVSVGGTSATVYRFPEGAQLVYANEGNQIMLGTSERAVGLMSRARQSKKSILTDGDVARVTGELTDRTSKLFMLHAGRVCRIAAQYEMSPDERKLLTEVVPEIAGDLVAYALTHESPTALSYHLAVDNLPRIDTILEHIDALAGLTGHHHHHRHAQRVAGDKVESNRHAR